MSPRAIIGLLMLVTEIAALYLAVDRLFHVAVPLCITVFLVLRGRRIEIGRDRYGSTVLGLLIGAVAWWLLFPPRLARSAVFFSGASEFIYMAAVYCAWHQILQLFADVRFKFETKKGPFPSFPFLGATVLAIAGLFESGDVAHRIFALTTAVYVFLTAASYLARDERWVFAAYAPRIKVVTIGILFVALALGFGTSVVIRKNTDTVDRLLYSLSGSPIGGAIGFSREGSLGSVTARKGNADQSPALFVTSDWYPGYMRGLVFDSYHHGRWNLPKADIWIFPGNRNAGEAEGRRDFALQPSDSSSIPRNYEVLTSTSLLDTVFLPPNTTDLRIETDSIATDNAGSVRESKPVRRPGYTAIGFASLGSVPLTTAEFARYTEVPPTLDPRIPEIAADVVADAVTTHEKAQAIQNYFGTHYKYQLGIRVPRGQDPLNYFLIEKPAAHCEYFASGAAIFLRLSGVPARYATGFVTAERNVSGDFYVARNKDAHAWVEAWDSEDGWFIVDASPEAAIPAMREAGYFRAWRDSIALAWARYRDGLSRESFSSLWNTIKTILTLMVTTPVGWGFGMTLLALVFFAVRSKRMRRPAAVPLADEIVSLHRLLARADSIALSAGAARGENETIRAFLCRLVQDTENPDMAALADWYRAYERVRYRDIRNAQASAFLESSLPTAP